MTSRPVVSIVEFTSCGVAIGWSTPDARAVALAAIVDIVARFGAIAKIERIDLVPQLDRDDAIAATTIERFTTAAPTLIRSDRRWERNGLWLNGLDTGFTLTHLDQGLAGCHCQFSGSCTDDVRDRFVDIVGDVLREHRAANTNVGVDFGAYSFLQVPRSDLSQETVRSAGEVVDGHWHVAVFHGPKEDYAPGVVLHAVRGGFEVRDELGQLGTPHATYGHFPTIAEAAREALRLLRARYGAPMRPCWGGASFNRALHNLGYSRGRVRWRWWPPGLELTGASLVSPSGAPEPTEPQANR